MTPKSQAAQLAASLELASGPTALSPRRTPPCCRKTASGALSLLVGIVMGLYLEKSRAVVGCCEFVHYRSTAVSNTGV